MSYQQSEDWDLCWSYLSNTGCRNSNCTWRHGNSASRLNPKQKYSGKMQCNSGYYRGYQRKWPSSLFHPIKNHQDVEDEDQHGLVQYPDIDDENSPKTFNFTDNAGHRRARSISSLMSVSSSGKTTTPRSISTLMNTSQVGSDSEDDMVKKVKVISMGEGTEFQEKENYMFSKGTFAEFLTSKTKLKTKLHPATTSLSPFAKVFVPRNSTSVKKCATAKLPVTLKQFLTPTKKLKIKFHPAEQIATEFSPFATVFVPRSNMASTRASSVSREESTMTTLPISTLNQPILKSSITFFDEN